MEHTLEHIVPFIENRIFLRVNKVKTQVSPVSKLKFLGYSFYNTKGKCRREYTRKVLRKRKNGYEKSHPVATARETHGEKRLAVASSGVGSITTILQI
jgi:hypothetical protein